MTTLSTSLTRSQKMAFFTRSLYEKVETHFNLLRVSAAFELLSISLRWEKKSKSELIQFLTNQSLVLILGILTQSTPLSASWKKIFGESILPGKSDPKQLLNFTNSADFNERSGKKPH